MTDTPGSDTRTVTIEREFRHPPERIWRALTQPHLLQEWLMESDFRPEIGHRFDFRAGWGEIACEVLEIKQDQQLSYRWVAHGLDSIVTWTLIPTDSGTLLRMDQTGFRADQKQAYFGAKNGWGKFLDALETMLAHQS